MVFLKGTSEYGAPYAININAITDLYYQDEDDYHCGHCTIAFGTKSTVLTTKSMEEIIEEIARLEKENGKSRVL